TVEMIGNGSITTQISNFNNLRLAKPGKKITMNNTFNVMGFLEFEGGTVTDGPGSYSFGLYTNVTDPLIIAPGTVMNFGTISILPYVAAVNIPSFHGYPDISLAAPAVSCSFIVQGGSITAGDVTIQGQSSYTGTLDLNGQDLGCSWLSIGGGFDAVVNAGTSKIHSTGNITIASNGTLNADASEISFEGNFNNSNGGVFDAGLSSVTLLGTGTQALFGSSTFYILEAMTPCATLQFEEGTTTYITDTINLQNISLRSTTNGTTWYLSYTGHDDNILNIDVKDSNASLSDYPLEAGNSVDLGNNTNWKFFDLWVSKPGAWNWDNPNAWENGSTPPKYADIDIVSGSTITLNLSTHTFSSIWIQPGGVLQPAVGSYEISIGSPTGNGSFEVEGSFMGRSGADTIDIRVSTGEVHINFTGTGDINNLFIENYTTATINSDLLINNIDIKDASLLRDNQGFNLSVKGHWWQYGSARYAGVNASSVTFIESSFNSIDGYSQCPGIEFQNLIINKSGNFVQISTMVYVLGNLSISSGTLSFTAADDTINVSSNIYISSGTFNGTAGGMYAFGGDIIQSSGSFNVMLSTVVLYNDAGFGKADQNIDLSTTTSIGHLLVVKKNGGTINLFDDIDLGDFSLDTNNDPSTVFYAQDNEIIIRNVFYNGNGIFDAGTSTVIFEPTTMGRLFGSTTFYGLRSVVPGTTLYFEAGQTTYVTNMVDFEDLTLRSDTADNQWYFNYSGSSQTLNNVDVQDSNASGGSPMVADGSSMDLGNNINWTIPGWESILTGQWSVGSTWNKGIPPVNGATVWITNSSTVTLNTDAEVAELVIKSDGMLKSDAVNWDIYMSSINGNGLFEVEPGGEFQPRNGAMYISMHISTGNIPISFNGKGDFEYFYIENGATATIMSDFTAQYVNINDGCVLDDSIGNNITVLKDFTQNVNAVYYTNALSSITFMGSEMGNINGSVLEHTFQNVIINKDGNNISFNGNALIKGNLVVKPPYGGFFGMNSTEFKIEGNIDWQGGSFWVENSTITLQGSNSQNIDVSSSPATTQKLGSLYVNKSGGTAYLMDNIRIRDAFDMDAGIFNAGSSIMLIEGSMNVNGGTFEGGNSEIIMSDNASLAITEIYLSPSSSLWDLTIERSFNTYNVDLLSDITITNLLEVATGQLNLDNFTHHFASAVVLSSGTLHIESSTSTFTGTVDITGGTFFIDGNGQLEIGSTFMADVNSEVIASSACVIKGISGNPFIFELSGLVDLSNKVSFFDSGLQIWGPTANIVRIDSVDFASCETAITINNGLTSHATFSWLYFDSSISTNIAYVTPDISSITVINSFGSKKGEAYENDPGNDQIFWNDNLDPEPITDMVAVTGRQINLQWTTPYDPPDASDSVAGFLVKISSTNGGFYNDADFNNGTTYYQSWNQLPPGSNENRILTGLAPGVTYHISIKTFDEDGNYSAWTSSATVNFVKSGYFIQYFMEGVAGETRDVSFGDYDNDNDLDYIVANHGSGDPVRINRQEPDGSFVNSFSTPETGNATSVAWGDYDNDGKLDFAVGLDAAGACIRIYHNEGGDSFVLKSTDTVDAGINSICWADTDNDGDLDVMAAGAHARLFRNNGNHSFTSIAIETIDRDYSDVAAGDLDEDGDMDFVLSDSHATNKGLYIYRNDGNNNFTESSIGGSNVYNTVALGDMDNDGSLDVVTVNADTSVVTILENLGSLSFATTWQYNAAANDIALGDYNNDGILDIAAGRDASSSILVFRSSAPAFSYSYEEEVGGGSTAAWADVDNDGDLDIFIGHDGIINKISASMEADSGAGNNPNKEPISVPSITKFSEENNLVKLEWTSGSDPETPANGLYYDVLIGTVDLQGNIVSPVNGSPLLGYNLRPKLTSGQRGIYLHPPLENTTYYAYVRVIDAGLKRDSEWSLQNQEYISIPPGKITGFNAANNNSAVEHEVDLSWTAPGDDGYYGDASYYELRYSTNPIINWNDVSKSTAALNVEVPYPPASQGSVENTTITGLAAYTAYYFVVYAMDETLIPAAQFTTTYCFTMDISSPTIGSLPPGDTTWYNADPGTIIDLDFYDIGSGLGYIDYCANDAPALGGTYTIAWSTLTNGSLNPVTAGATYYETDWKADFADLAENVTNYISVRIFDVEGNWQQYNDVFTLKKDTTTPAIDIQQPGDDIWRSVNVSTYNVNFNDTGGSKLSMFWVQASTVAGGGSPLLPGFQTVQSGIDANSYSTDWSLPGANVWDLLLSDNTNYISILVEDLAGNTSTWVDAFYVLKDTDVPKITNGTAVGDSTTWRISSGTVYNVTFGDAGGSNLSHIQTRAATGAGGSGILEDWTDLITNIDSPNHASGIILSSTTWTLLDPGTNYISVRVYDFAGSSDTAVDAFRVLKDTNAPQYWDNQSGDDVWRNISGTVYDVRFYDYESFLTGAEYTVYTGMNQSVEMRKDWTPIFTSTGTPAYTSGWQVDFNSLKDSTTNYVSFRAFDVACNTMTINDVFYVLKDTTPPIITNKQTGDADWRKAAGTTYNVDFEDAASGLVSGSSVTLRYSAWTGLGLTGLNPISSSTLTLGGLNTGDTYYTTDWQIDDFNLLKDEATNYISIEVYDTAGNTSTLVDLFYIQKDTTPPTYTIAAGLIGGDTTWMNVSGTTYDVDFAAVGAVLTGASYAVNTQALQAGTTIVQLMPIAGVSGLSHTADWGIGSDFNDLINNAINYVTLEIYDIAYNTTTIQDAFFIRKDTTPPVSNITTPSNAYEKYVDQFGGTSNDSASGVDNVWLRINDGGGNYWDGYIFDTPPVWVLASGTAGWNYGIADTEWNSGTTYYVNSRAFDIAANEQIGFSTYTFLYDNVAPVSSITYPTATHLSVLSTVSGTAGDVTSPLAQIQLEIYNITDNTWWNSSAWVGAPVLNQVEGTANWYENVSTVTWQNDKQYLLTLHVDDMAQNNSQASTKQFIFDTTAPALGINLPVNNARRSALPTISGTTDDDGNGAVQLVELRVYDASITFQYWNETSHGWDGDDTSWFAATNPSAWEIWYTTYPTWNTGRQYQIEARVQDVAENYGTAYSTVSFIYDTNIPQSGISYPITGGGNFINELTVISGTAVDTGSNKGSIINQPKIAVRRNSDGLWWNSGNVDFTAGTLFPNNTPPGDPANWYYPNLTSTDLTDGVSYYITTQAQDNATPANVEAWYNVRSATFTFDTTEPVSGITLPLNGGYYNNDANQLLNISGTAGDAVAGVSMVEFSIKEVGTNMWWEEAGSTFSATGEEFLPMTNPSGNVWVSTAPALQNDYQYLVRMRSYDNAGNIEVLGAGNTFTFDTNEPDSGVSLPLEGVAYNSLPGISGTASDNTTVAITSVSVREVGGNWYNGSTTFTATSENYFLASGPAANWYVNAIPWQNGYSYQIVSKAQDTSGILETTLSSRTFLFDNEIPACEVTYPTSTFVSSISAISGTALDNYAEVNAVYVSIESPALSGSYWNGSTFTAPTQYFNLCTSTDIWTYSGFNSWTNNVTYRIAVKAVDFAGNVSVIGSTRTFTYVNDKPESAVTLPVHGSYYTSSITTISGTAESSIAEVDSVKVAVLNQTSSMWYGGTDFNSPTKVFVDVTEGTGTWFYDIDQSKFVDTNQYLVQSYAIDTSNPPLVETQFDVGIDSNVFTYDISNPTSTITLPVDNSYVNSSLTLITGTADDGTSGISDVKISMKNETTSLWWNGSTFSATGEQFVDVDTTSIPAWIFNVNGIFENGHVYKARTQASDYALNSEVLGSSITFNYDIGQPTSTIVYPADNSYFSSIQPLMIASGTWTDNFSGVQNLYLQVKDGSNNYFNGTSFTAGVSSVSAQVFSSSWSYNTAALSGVMDHDTYT
ncbi:MAG: FG-GAP-like repeat-containing protein, partial [bacterium]